MSQKTLGACGVLALVAVLVGLMVAPASAVESDPEIDLAVTKTDTMDPVQPGDTFDYPIVVTNNGPSGAFMVWATDTLPAEVSFVSASSGCTYDGASTVECNIGAMAPGDSVSRSITVQVKADTPEGTFTNLVEVENRETGDTAPIETDLSNNQDTEDTTVALGSIGDTVWFDTNSNGVQDAGEPGIAGITVSLGGGPTSRPDVTTDANGNYLFDGLVRGDYTTTVTPPARHDATTPTSYDIGLGMGEDFLDADFGFVQIDLELTKTVDPDTVIVDPGSPPFPTTTFTVAVVNQGPGDATGVVVGDVLPAGLVYVSDTGGGAFDPGTFVWTIGSLPVGASTSLDFVVEVTDVGSFTNVAEVIAADQIDVDSEPADGMGDDYDEATVVAESVVLAAGLLGDTVFFDVNGNGIQNSGEPGISGVGVSIVCPAGTTSKTTNGNGNYTETVDPPGSCTVTVNQSTVSIVVDGQAVPSSQIKATTPKTRTGVVPDGGQNLTFDFGFTIMLPDTGFSRGGFGIAGAVLLLMGAGVLLVVRRGNRLLDR